MYKKVLIPIDGSEQSLKAAHQGAELAKRFDATVTLFHVVPVLTVDRLRSIVIDEVKVHGKELLEQAARDIAAYGIPADTEMVPGHPADAIVLKARVNGYDLIIMGSSGLSGIKGYLLGSVSSTVSRHAPCSVLIIR